MFAEFLEESGRIENLTSLQDVLAKCTKNGKPGKIGTNFDLGHVVNVLKSSKFSCKIVRGDGWFVLIGAYMVVDSIMQYNRLFGFGDRKRYFTERTQVHSEFLEDTEKNRKFTEKMISVAARIIARCNTEDEVESVMIRMFQGKTSWKIKPGE